MTRSHLLKYFAPLLPLKAENSSNRGHVYINLILQYSIGGSDNHFISANRDTIWVYWRNKLKWFTIGRLCQMFFTFSLSYLSFSWFLSINLRISPLFKRTSHGYLALWCIIARNSKEKGSLNKLRPLLPVYSGPTFPHNLRWHNLPCLAGS